MVPPPLPPISGTQLRHLRYLVICTLFKAPISPLIILIIPFTGALMNPTIASHTNLVVLLIPIPYASNLDPNPVECCAYGILYTIDDTCNHTHDTVPNRAGNILYAIPNVVNNVLDCFKCLVEISA